ncbi:S-adenosyl-L-methionine-dependent methyltransferase [Panaeolus papilionaceus]|nr:S-adenosyl-L-methionine-dependent methyltransferase [Panaeolus papilionaceus]
MSGACCNHNNTTDTSAALVDKVNEAYSARARTERDDALSAYSNKVAKAFGYTEEQLRAIPDSSHIGLSCGNPVAAATIKQGETVVDLGSGGGIDVFLAAEKVGPTGQVIGLDISPDMIELARRNAAQKDLKPPQVAFVQASLTEPLPLESNSVDCILSNCVLNLLPHDGKVSLLKEVFRVLKPGGRIVLDDIVAKKPLPDNIRNDVGSYIGCVAGAITIAEYEKLMSDAGFKDSVLVATKNDLGVYFESAGQGTGCCASSAPPSLIGKPSYDINEWVASYQIYAAKGEDEPVDKIQTEALLRWADAYPKVKSSPEVLEDEEVVALIRNQGNPEERSTDYVVVDVRGDDHAGGHVRGSDNWPARPFYDNLPEFYEKYQNTPKVIFYCNRSNGRGPRSAAWYQDYLDAHGGKNSKAYVLKGGVKNWLEKYEGQEDLVDRD